ncbi:alpha/beta hydrolase [Nocardia sp. BMG51109]|uniref:alpha/beta hydrolase n=1 Tax=Nocardia sp. BMG51109 TaxID=1056816 RepID=UPI000464C20E|nr:alpha/beta fold hydrolase [Nocardia sp. BMG51109]
MQADRVTFASAGTALTGYVYTPEHPAPGSACVVICPGFGGTQDTPSIIAAATAFTEAGYLAVTFDYRGFGQSDGHPRQVPDIPGQLEDVRAATEFGRSYPGVDPDRMVLWGSSLGGGHVVSAAAADPRIAAVVAQVPFNGFPKKAEGRSATATLRLLAAMFRDRLRGALGRPPLYIPAVGRTGDLAVMTGPGAEDTIAAMASETWENRVAPRALLQMARYKPGDRAPELRMPLLVCIGEYDRETVGADTVELARKAPHGELRSYPFAHFDIYRADNRTRVLDDQVAFLERVLTRAR